MKECVILGIFLVSVCSGAGAFCPNLKLEAQAGKPFDANVSITNCTSMCDGVVCVLTVNVTNEVDNYTLTITDCLTIRVQGESYVGETELTFHYVFMCHILNPPPSEDADASLLLRGVEMEIVLMNEEEGGFVESGSTVELSCFSHLNDSSDILVSFHLTRGNDTLTVSCPSGDPGSSLGCVSPVRGREWQVCRNKTEPHNCFLVVHDFDDSDGGNYSCSTLIAGEDVQSNVLNLQALKALSPAKKPWKALSPAKKPSKDSSPKSKLIIGLGVGVGGCLLILVVVVIAVNAVRSYRRSASERYQRLMNEDNENDDVYTPGASSPIIEGACVNVGRADAGNGEDADASDHRSTTPEPTVSVVQPSGPGLTN